MRNWGQQSVYPLGITPGEMMRNSGTGRRLLLRMKTNQACKKKRNMHLLVRSTVMIHFKMVKDKNVLVHCQLCGAIRILTVKNSTSNLLKHLKAQH